VGRGGHRRAGRGGGRHANGRVAIYNGIPTEILGFGLSHVEQTTELFTADAQALQPWQGLSEGITANSFEEAEAIVEQIRQDLQLQAGPP